MRGLDVHLEPADCALYALRYCCQSSSSLVGHRLSSAARKMLSKCGDCPPFSKTRVWYPIVRSPCECLFMSNPDSIQITIPDKAVRVKGLY